MKKWILLLAICLTAALLVPAYAAQGTLILPRELKTIGPEAFAGVRDVNQIVLPDGLTEIGDRAFADSGLGLIVMTDSVEKIASTALDGSPNACFAAMNAHQAEVCDKAGVRYMRYISDAEGAQVAESCEKAGVPYVQYKDEEGSVTVTKMNGKQAEVVIPSEILGKPVKKIEQDCFKENENLTSVVISEGITTIGSSAFSGCKNLESVTMADTVTEIGNNAFRNCGNLTDVEFSAGLTKIGGDAFNGTCAGQEEAVIFELPDSVKELGGNTFRDCGAVLCVARDSDAETTVRNAQYTYTHDDETDFRYKYDSDKDAERIIAYTGSAESVEIPAQVWLIEEGIFKDHTELKKVVVSEGVTRIGEEAFQGCTNLTDITLPESLQEIENNAFNGCGSAEGEGFRLQLPGNITWVAATGVFTDSPVILVCDKDSETAKTLSGRGYSFARDDRPEEEDFRYRWDYFNHVYDLGLYDYAGKETVVRLPDDCRNVNSERFRERSDLTLVCAQLSDAASGLSDAGLNFTFPGHEELLYRVIDGVLYIMGYTGSGNEIIIPTADTYIKAGVDEQIRANAFNGKQNVTKAVLPEGLTRINYDAFTNCYKLTDITFPSTLKYIDQNSFRWCGRDVSEVFYFVLPDTMEDLSGRGGGATAFSDCNAVLVCGKTSATAALLTDRNYVYTAPGEYDFRYRYEKYTEGEQTGRRLWLIGYEGTDKQVTIPAGIWGIKRFDGTTDSTYWRTFHGDAFYGNETVEKVVIPEGTVAIESDAFTNCYKLSDITFPSTLKKLNQNAFRYCGRDAANTIYFVLPDTLETIVARGGGATTFSDCNAVLVCGKTSAAAALLTDSNYVYTVPGELDFRYRYEKYTEGEQTGRRLWLVGYEGTDKQVTIPSGIWGIKRFNGTTDSTYWRTFHGDAFYGNETVEKVVIPEGTVAIESDAFTNCYKLSDITFPSTLKKLDQNVFRYCGRDVTETFYFVLPDNMEEVVARRGGAQTFSDCNAVLQTGKYSQTAKLLTAQNFCYTVEGERDFRYRYRAFEEDGKTVYRLYLSGYAGTGPEVVIPEGIYAIAMYQWDPPYGDYEPDFFKRTDLTKVVIPEGTVRIEDSAFKGCTNLTDITFPTTLKVIENHAFEECGKASAARHFYVLPDDMEEVSTGGWGAFNDLGEGRLVCTAGSATAKLISNEGNGYEFALKGHQEDGLLYRWELRKNENDENVSRLILRRYEGSSAEVTIPSGLGIWGITESVFKDMHDLRKVFIPEGVAEIKADVFDNCTLLHQSGVEKVNGQDCLVLRMPTTLKTIEGSVTFRSVGAGFTAERFYLVLPASLGQFDIAIFTDCNAVFVAPEGSHAAAELYNGWYRYYYTLEDAVARKDLQYKMDTDANGNPVLHEVYYGKP